MTEKPNTSKNAFSELAKKPVKKKRNTGMTKPLKLNTKGSGKPNKEHSPAAPISKTKPRSYRINTYIHNAHGQQLEKLIIDPTIRQELNGKKPKIAEIIEMALGALTDKYTVK